MKKDYINYARYANFAISFGVTSVAAMLLGFFGGKWLDNKFGTTPVFLLLGIFLGIALTFKSLLTELKIMLKSEEMQKEMADKREKKE